MGTAADFGIDLNHGSTGYTADVITDAVMEFMVDCTAQ